MRVLAALFALLVVSVPALGHDYQLGALKIGHPVARETIGQSRITAGYLTVENGGDEDDRLIGAESDGARVIEIHTHKMDGGVARMMKIDGLDVPAGGTATLQPGGNHLMIFDVTGALEPGDTLPVTLIFEKAGSIDVDLNIEKIGGHNHAH